MAFVKAVALPVIHMHRKKLFELSTGQAKLLGSTGATTIEVCAGLVAGQKGPRPALLAAKPMRGRPLRLTQAAMRNFGSTSSRRTHVGVPDCCRLLTPLRIGSATRRNIWRKRPDPTPSPKLLPLGSAAVSRVGHDLGLRRPRYRSPHLARSGSALWPEVQA